jgi:hypothetical protein
LLVAVETNAVVAICVLLVPTDAVGVVGVPVNAGDSLNTLLPLPVTTDAPVPPCATARVPLLMFVAFVVSVVADAARPLIAVLEIDPVAAVIFDVK